MADDWGRLVAEAERFNYVLVHCSTKPTVVWLVVCCPLWWFEGCWFVQLQVWTMGVLISIEMAKAPSPIMGACDLCRVNRNRGADRVRGRGEKRGREEGEEGAGGGEEGKGGGRRGGGRRERGGKKGGREKIARAKHAPLQKGGGRPGVGGGR